MTTVSVVIPTYNLSEYLEECVLSALCQTYSPLEVLIVDNNSTDDTITVAQQLASKYNVIKILLEPRQGAPHARNRGLAEARGEWIQFLDGDDILLAGKIEHQLFFGSHGTDFIVSPAINRTVKGKDSVIPLRNNIWLGLFESGGYMGYTSSILWRTTSVRKVSGWDSNLASNQEYDLMYRLLNAGFVASIAPEPLTIRRHRDKGQISSTPYAEFLNTAIPVRTKVLRHIIEQQYLEPKEMRSVFTTYYRLYTHLKIRRPELARKIDKQWIAPTITPLLKRKYPIIYWLEFQSGLISASRVIKGFLGRRGLLRFVMPKL